MRYLVVTMLANRQSKISFLHLFQEPCPEETDEPAGLRLGEIEIRTETREQMAQTTGLFAASFRLF